MSGRFSASPRFGVRGARRQRLHHVAASDDAVTTEQLARGATPTHAAGQAHRDRLASKASTPAPGPPATVGCERRGCQRARVAALNDEEGGGARGEDRPGPAGRRRPRRHPVRLRVVAHHGHPRFLGISRSHARFAGFRARRRGAGRRSARRSFPASAAGCPRAAMQRGLLIAGASLALLGRCAANGRAALRGGGGAAPARRVGGPPFFPQDQRYLCGPGRWRRSCEPRELAVTPPDLVPQVYVPSRQVVAGEDARRHAPARGDVCAAPKLGAAAEVAGTPVVITSRAWACNRRPRGVRRGGGLRPRRRARAAAVRPCAAAGDGPAHLRAHLDARTTGLRWRSRRAACRPWAGRSRALARAPSSGWPLTLAVRAYEAALTRWPGVLTLRMGLGNALHAAGRKAGSAAEMLRAAARQHRHAAAWINLGTVALGSNAHRAEAAAREAVALGGRGPRRPRATGPAASQRPRAAALTGRPFKATRRAAGSATARAAGRPVAPARSARA